MGIYKKKGLGVLGAKQKERNKILSCMFDYFRAVC